VAPLLRSPNVHCSGLLSQRPLIAFCHELLANPTAPRRQRRQRHGAAGARSAWRLSCDGDRGGSILTPGGRFQLVASCHIPTLGLRHRSPAIFPVSADDDRSTPPSVTGRSKVPQGTEATTIETTTAVATSDQSDFGMSCCTWAKPVVFPTSRTAGDASRDDPSPNRLKQPTHHPASFGAGAPSAHRAKRQSRRSCEAPG
jgi:hypothetical protein